MTIIIPNKKEVEEIVRQSLDLEFPLYNPNHYVTSWSTANQTYAASGKFVDRIIKNKKILYTF